MVSDTELRKTIFKVIKDFELDLFFMVPAYIQSSEMVADAEQIGLSLQFEAFADRAYHHTGELVGRAQPNAVLTLPEAETPSPENCSRLINYYS